MDIYDPGIPRYLNVQTIKSSLNPFDDAVNLVSTLSSYDYLVELLTGIHNLTLSDARQRVKLILPHVRVALNYAKHGIAAEEDIAFLLLYYAMLNMLKVYIIVGPYNNELETNRWHGATYSVNKKNSHNLFTEEITIKRGGAIPLFYKTICGNTITQEITLKISNLYSLSYEIGDEYKIVTGKQNSLRLFTYQETAVDGVLKPVLVFQGGGYNIRSVSALYNKPWTKLRGKVEFSGPQNISGLRVEENIWQHINNFMIINPYHGRISLSPIFPNDIFLTEELVITLIFFHLSNVVRYKPEFMEKIKSSRYWPLVVAARTRLLYKSLLLLWSFIHKKTLVIENK